MNDSYPFIADLYSKHRTELIRFFAKHIGDTATAEDLTQDVFMRLLERKNEIRTESVCGLMYVVAHNILKDHLRRKYVKEEFKCHIAESSLLYDTSTESAIIAADIFRLECRIIAGLSPARKKAYVLTRLAGWSSKEIAGLTGHSRRTEENNVFASRKIVRDALRHCC
ncbi:MAG: sigma-70 family RNA polymerase sigma factor [Muribaculaceae bacterium]|nr:sigma-70 family RNA polymerase sigma factor [Muribaculaceae bacterium]